MKIFIFGGQKSGKTAFAIQKALHFTDPTYVATYDNSYKDKEMEKRVQKHRKERTSHFTTLEEPLNLHTLQEKKTYVIDCITMWILNMITQDFSDKKILKRVDKLLALQGDFIFVLNELNLGVVPLDKLSRRFVDLSGIVGQKFSKACDEVFEVKFGIQKRLL